MLLVTLLFFAPLKAEMRKLKYFILEHPLLKVKVLLPLSPHQFTIHALYKAYAILVSL